MILPLVALITLSGHAQQSSATWLNYQIQKYVEWKTLDDLAEAVRKDNRLPGLCLAYQMGDKSEASVTGLRNMQNTTMPIEDDDRLLVGPIGKTMTAMMIARLIEMQKFGWKSTLGEALPNIKMLDAYKTVTIEQLLHHKGGIPQVSSFKPTELAKLLEKPESATKLREVFVTALLSREPEQGKSTDTDYVVAGYLAEHVLRQSYEWLMDRFVFNPLKMSTAMIAPLGSDDQVGSIRGVQEHIQADFGYQAYVMPPSKMDYVLAPAGIGISCSISDFLAYAVAHLNGIKGKAKGITADSYKFLHTPAPNEHEVMGWTIDPSYAGEQCQKSTGTDGAFYSELTLWPENNLAIVAITNAGTLRMPAPTTLAILAVKAKLEKKDDGSGKTLVVRSSS